MIRATWLGSVLALALTAAELPVRQVVLYKHGVGYFERAGELAPGESARLDFKAAEMNDVLKSLTIEEKGGGKISGLRYDSSEPLARSWPISLPGWHGPAPQRGARSAQGRRDRDEVRQRNRGWRDCGARLIAGDDKRPEREQITLLMDTGDLRNFDLGAAASIRFTDPKLQVQFKDYLTALTDARSKEKRSVYIDSTDAKEPRGRGQLHDSDAGLEIELPADLR